MANICKVNEKSIQEAAAIIRAGGVIVVPTDTVYGVACDPFNKQAVEKIYQLKRRSHTKALQILMSGVDDLAKLGLVLPNPLDRLAQRFLPGGFSPIARLSDIAVPSGLATVRKGEDGETTQGVRVPDCLPLMQILQATGPLAASSANRSGNESADSVQEAVAAFGDEIALYLDAGSTRSHVASTVVAACAEQPDGIVILRQGVLSEATIRASLHEVV